MMKLSLLFVFVVTLPGWGHSAHLSRGLMHHGGSIDDVLKRVSHSTPPSALPTTKVEPAAVQNQMTDLIRNIDQFAGGRVDPETLNAWKQIPRQAGLDYDMNHAFFRQDPFGNLVHQPMTPIPQRTELGLSPGNAFAARQSGPEFAEVRALEDGINFRGGRENVTDNSRSLEAHSNTFHQNGHSGSNYQFSETQLPDGGHSQQEFSSFSSFSSQ